MSGARDLYSILGIDADATAAEVTAAYRRRVRQLHPDSGSDGATDGASDSGSADELAAVLDAYRVLRDPARRAAYDRQRPVSGPSPTPPTSVQVRVRRPARTDREPDLRIGPVRRHRS